MGALYPCKHCNGTTFCSASRDAAGKLKTRAACVCCLVKAGLNPQGVYDKVVCSVCGGRGMVEPARITPKAQRARDRWLLLAMSAALAAALLLLGLSAFAYYRQQQSYDDMIDQIMEERGPAASLPLSEARASVHPGMSKDAVRLALGEPSAIRAGENDQELWMYRCKDGRLLITILNGSVYGRQ